MKNKKLRISTVLIMLLVIIVIALLIFLGVLIIKLLGNKTTTNNTNNTISNNIRNGSNETANVVNATPIGIVNQVGNMTNATNTTNTVIQPGVENTVPSDYVFKLDSRKKYKIITDTRILTRKDELSSYTDIYYQVDLENGIISAVTDQYPAKSASDQTVKRSAVSKVMTEKFQAEIKNIINEVISRADDRDDGGDTYFRITSLDREKRIYNAKSIEDLKEIIKKFNDLE